MDKEDFVKTYSRQTLVNKIVKEFLFEQMNDWTKYEMECYILDHGDRGEIIWHYDKRCFDVKFYDGQVIETKINTIAC